MDVRVGDRRVLVAEDEFVIALEIEDTLRRAGYEVVGPAATAGEAERLAAEEPLDAAVLDLELRDGTAVAAADALAGRGIPFVFLSGYGAEVLPGHLRGRAVLDKPFAVERLPAAVEAAAREQRGARAGARDLGAGGPASGPGSPALGRGRGATPGGGGPGPGARARVS
jgi:DNA-binding response OmpR family regulator